MGSTVSWTILLYGLVPLAAFVVVDVFAGIKAGFIMAVLLSIGEIFVMHQSTGSWDPISFVAAALIIVLGGVSIRLGNSTYFKFQPVIVCLALAGFVTYLQFFDTPVVYRYLPVLKEVSPSEVKQYLEDKVFLETLNSLFNWVIAVILIHGALMAYAALRWGNVTWLIVRGIGFWVLSIVMVIIQLIYLCVKGI
jgi:intracellular septation protein